MDAHFLTSPPRPVQPQPPVGAHNAYIERKTKEIGVVDRMIKTIQPNAAVNPVDPSITPGAQAGIAHAEVTFG